MRLSKLKAIVEEEEKEIILSIEDVIDLVRRELGIALAGIILIFVTYYFDLPKLWRELSVALFIAGSGLIALRLLEFLIVKTLPKEVNPQSVANIVKIFGYLFIVLIIVSIFELNFAILGGTVMGIILGFAAQPTLGNLFAGLLILLSRTLVPGDRVIIASKKIPIQITQNPSYKFFSRNYVFPGYEVTVKEIGLFFTKVETIEGIEINIPNSLLLESVIIKQPVERVVNIRLEVPLSKLDLVINKIRELGKGLQYFKLGDIVVEEQSDKTNVIIRITGKASNPLKARTEFLQRVAPLLNEIYSQQSGS